MRLHISALSTSLFQPKQNLKDFLLAHIPPLQEGDVLVVTSKIVSLAEGRTLPKSEISKKDLIEREADHVIGEMNHGVILTIKDSLMIASAGIDESNSPDDGYILFPEKPFDSAQKVWEELRAHFKLQNLGIILSDSFTLPLRRGVRGVALSWWGFESLKSLIGQDDLFGRKFTMSTIHLADSLAASGVLVMGEGDRPTPLALIRGAEVKFIEGCDKDVSLMSVENDMYAPLYQDRIKRR